MTPDEWTQSDVLDFEFLSAMNPFDRGHEGTDEVLDVVESTGSELFPRTISFDKGTRKYSRRLLHERLAEFKFANGEYTSITLDCAPVPESFFHISGYKGHGNSRFSFQLYLKPFSWCREAGKQAARVGQLIDLVRTLAARIPLSHGYIHSNTDRLLDTDLDSPDPGVPDQVERVYWLNVYGPRLVQSLGRERVLSTPAWHVEELPHGAKGNFQARYWCCIRK